jgi:rSAM/selenodomain-associated transferase 1
VDVLLVFLKHPRAGAAKTRMIPALGPVGAASFSMALAEAALRQTRPEKAEYERLVFFAPEEAASDVASWLPGETLLPQRGADLGERLAHAFATAFSRGASRVVVIGTDCPGLTRRHVRDAFSGLGDGKIVLGPARDGGYYLLAMASAHPELFRGIAWSTPRVLLETAEKAEGLGLDVTLLEVLRDIDTPEDARAEWQTLRPLLDEGLRESFEGVHRGDR